jgi:hypothetical protein
MNSTVSIRPALPVYAVLSKTRCHRDSNLAISSATFRALYTMTYTQHEVAKHAYGLNAPALQRWRKSNHNSERAAFHLQANYVTQ